jgi:Methionyl-tRNA formyltransferase
MKKNIIIVGGHEQACNMFELLLSSNDVEIQLCILRSDDKGDDDIFPSLQKKAKTHGIPTIQPKSLNNSLATKVVKRYKPDIILSLQNNMIFSDSWISMLDQKLGIVNIHYAPLPKYAGFWPEMWAIWNDERDFAVTMHYVNKGIDTGTSYSSRMV